MKPSIRWIPPGSAACALLAFLCCTPPAARTAVQDPEAAGHLPRLNSGSEPFNGHPVRDAGAPFQFRGPRLGSWGQTIKEVGTISDPAWDGDDIPAYVEALEETGQNLVVYNINTERDWADILELLETTKGMDLQILAAIKAPHHSQNESIWFPDGLPERESDGDAACWICDRLYLSEWLSAWIDAAATCSMLSLAYPNLEGFVIDDFDGYVESADFPAQVFGDRLGLFEVQQIAEAARSHNPEFKFLPLTYYSNFGRNVGEGYILGSNYGVKLFSDEEMRVQLRFMLAEKPSRAVLSFFHGDTVQDCDGINVYREVYVNGLADENRVWQASVAGDQDVEFFSEDIASKLRPGWNEIHLQLNPELAGSATNEAYHGRGDMFWRIWGVTVEGWMIHRATTGLYMQPFVRASFEERFSVIAHPDPYQPAVGGMGFEGGVDAAEIRNTDSRVLSPWGSLDLSGAEGVMDMRLVAARNHSAQLRDVVPGLVATSTRASDSEEVITCGGIAAPAWKYNGEVFQKLLESTREHLVDRAFVSLHWAMHSDALIQPNLLVDQLERAASIADATAVWNWPIGVHFLEEARGVFGESASTAADYQIMGFWPGRQQDLPGWRQSWILTGLPEGQLVDVVIADNRAEDSGASGKLIKSVASVSSEGDVSPIYGPADVAADGKEAILAASFRFESAAVFSMDFGAGTGDWPVRVHFSISTEDGWVDPSLFHFESGLTDAFPIEVYDAVAGLYSKIRREAMSTMGIR